MNALFDVAGRLWCRFCRYRDRKVVIGDFARRVRRYGFSQDEARGSLFTYLVYSSTWRRGYTIDQLWNMADEWATEMTEKKEKSA